ncbi:predicted protein [Nematostella vectensis]|uniref:Chromatin-remodeling ATPase INO80 n=1 Tax=Nematostella vectensis TaxID=45351 RepID=A7RIX4_NEMVE|nr:predicted protein [Nematostella vectensis]|eukprot:XP_001640537.1 predicted protein [Nematostella vectensis]
MAAAPLRRGMMVMGRIARILPTRLSKSAITDSQPKHEGSWLYTLENPPNLSWLRPRQPGDTDDSEVGDLGKTLPEGIRLSLVNGDVSDSGSLINGCLRPEELHVDKSRLYNFTKVKKDRRWLKEMLLSDSSSSSDEEQPMTDEDLHEMLWLHKQQKLARQRFLRGGELSQYQHYSASLLYTQDKYHDSQKQRGNAKKLKKKKMKDGSLKIVKVKKEKMRIKKKRKKSEDQSDGDRRESGTIDERLMKRTLIRRKEADAKRRKLWALICRKEIPRTQRQKSSARNNTLSNAKKLAQLCQKERRREAQRSQKIAQQTVPRARRLVREMMVYWKKYEKVEKEHRKRVEKEAMEQRKLDDELREARRQQRKLNFLITQTELYAHFMGKKLKGNKMSASSDVHHILSKLDEPSDKSKIKSVSGGVLIDMENSDNYDARAMKMEALANAENAFRLQEAKRQAFDVNSQESGGSKKIALSQESFDVNFSLANPNISGEDHPQPNLFQGKLKTYQLKGMNWLISLYEQGISGILADEMGLGKTVQSIAFLSYLAETHNIWGPFLVVAPASTLHNWQQEVSRFIPQFKVLPYWGNQGDRKSLRKFWSQKQTHISDRNHAPFHLLITSYQLVVQDVRYFQRIKWQYIVLDEAQAIKSSSSVRWKILLGYQCRNRLLLTGTPIQNSMAELWALLHFIMPTLFDNHEEFNEWFSKDIESHAENKSLIDQNQLSRLHMILKPFMLRRIKKDVENELSEKIEIKLVCGLTTRQKWLYQAVKQKISIDDLVYTSASSSATSATTSSLMNLVMQFRKVCNHPELFERRDVTSPVTVQLPPYVIPKLIYRKVPESECFSFLRFAGISLEEASMMMLGSPSHRLLLLLILLRKVMLLHHKRSWSPSKSSSSVLVPNLMEKKVVAVCELSYCSDRSAAYEHQELARGGPDESRNLLLYGSPEAVDMKEYRAHLFPPPLGGLEATQPSKGWSFVQMPNRNSVISDSGKLTVLDGLLTKLKLQGHRVLIYSQMTRMIDILEEYMTFRKHKYMRLDGSSKISDRRDMVADFQNNKDIFVFLLSTRAGGLGINLTAADTVIFYDSDWNPTVDEQAMDRAHRLGQTKQVTVYRLVTKNTIEERILQRAREKSEIQKMVISGGNFKPDALKPKEVVSLLLDDEELENKFLQRQAEKKADEQRKRRERKRKKGGTDEGTSSPSIEISETSTPPPKAKKGRKSKTSLFPPAPEGVPTASVPPSEASSVNGDASARLEGADADDISVMSLDEISMVSGDGSLYSMDAPPSSSATPFNEDSLLGDAEPKSETASPSTAEGKRGRGRGRARGRGRTRGRGTAPIRTSRGRGRGRGGTGVMAASAAASAAAAAASAAAYAAYGFTFQGTPTPPPPAARSSPVAFGSGGSTVPGSAVTHPVPRYDNSSANSSPARHRDVEN